MGWGFLLGLGLAVVGMAIVAYALDHGWFNPRPMTSWPLKGGHTPDQRVPYPATPPPKPRGAGSARPPGTVRREWKVCPCCGRRLIVTSSDGHVTLEAHG